MKFWLLFDLLLAASVSCANTARTDEPGEVVIHTIVWSQEAFDKAAIRPGDVVVVQNGVYRNTPVRLNVDASVGRPVHIKAQTPGGVVLTGTSSLSIGGAYLIISGFHFRDCDVAAGDAVFNFRTSPKAHASHSRLSDCVFSGTGLPENKEKEIKWVSVYGTDNEISRCSFIDKKVLGSLLVVWVTPQVTPGHRIRANYFSHPVSLRENGSAINGQEMIRIGTSAVSMADGGCEVCDNYFDRCNGEVEIVSNKSCRNVYRNNLFDRCQGTLTLRHGNDCVVEGNYFFGHGEANTGGVRIIGERHRVFNNYFEELEGTDQRSAIALLRGVENSELFEYFQVKGAEVTFNTIVDCKSGIMANTGNSVSTMPVTDSRIAGNLIVGSVSGKAGVTVNNTCRPDISWNGNYVYGVTVSGAGRGVETTRHFDLVRDRGIYVLPADKAGQYGKMQGFSYVETDIRGARRPSGKTPGASEPGGLGNRIIPGLSTTGATWKPNLKADYE